MEIKHRDVSAAMRHVQQHMISLENSSIQLGHISEDPRFLGKNDNFPATQVNKADLMDRFLFLVFNDITCVRDQRTRHSQEQVIRDTKFILKLFAEQQVIPGGFHLNGDSFVFVAYQDEIENIQSHLSGKISGGLFQRLVAVFLHRDYGSYRVRFISGNYSEEFRQKPDALAPEQLRFIIIMLL